MRDCFVSILQTFVEASSIMLPSSTKIWLNPFVAKTIKELYDMQYHQEFLVTRDLLAYYCQPGLSIVIVKLDENKAKEQLCKVIYNNGKNSLIYPLSCIDYFASREVATIESLKQKNYPLRLVGIKYDFVVESIEPVELPPNETFYQVRQSSSVYSSPNLYLFIGDEPICIRI